MNRLVCKLIDIALEKGTPIAEIIAHCDGEATKEEVLDYITSKFEAEVASMEVSENLEK